MRWLNNFFITHGQKHTLDLWLAHSVHCVPRNREKERAFTELLVRYMETSLEEEGIQTFQLPELLIFLTVPVK